MGIAFSRFQMRHFSARYSKLERATLSYGPCQTPTLGFVVRRHLEIDAFQSAPFWRLLLVLRLDGTAEAEAEAEAAAAEAEAVEAVRAVGAAEAVEGREAVEGEEGRVELRYDYDGELYAQADFLLECAIVSIAIASTAKAGLLLECDPSAVTLITRPATP